MTAARALSYPQNDPAIEAARDAAPSNLRAEIVAGNLMMAPAPSWAHQNASAELVAILRSAAALRTKRGAGGEAPTGWQILAVPELHLGPMPDKSNPDLAGWRAHHAPGRANEKAIAQVPDWICEVLSPSTESYDRGTKLPMFASHGVSHAWLVDPESRCLEVFRLERGALRQIGRFDGAVSVSVEPFSEVRFELASLFE